MPGRLNYCTEDLRRMYFDEGRTCEGIAKSLGLGTGKTVGQHLRKAGFALRIGGERIRLPADEMALAYWRDEKSTAEVASQFRCSQTTVRRRLAARAGLRSRGASTKNRKGKCAPRWSGGRPRTVQGYVMVHAPSHPMASKAGYVLEHRLVASEHLGRTLGRKEEVHHLNGIKDDNRWENLVVVQSGKHQKLHADHNRKVWALQKRVELLEAMLHRGESWKVVG